MSIFKFKQFCIQNTQSAMKVNTDAVLLGACCNIDYLKHLPKINCLDIGTGTGVISLMLAQRIYELLAQNINTQYIIEGIDIDSSSVQEALTNCNNSPWKDNLNIKLQDLKTYCPNKKYDLIVSNPPYFINSLNANEARRNCSRHTISLDYKDILQFAYKYLNHSGCVSLILPINFEKDVYRFAATKNLYLQRIIRIKTTPTKIAKRMVVEFGFNKTQVIDEELIIQQNNIYTPQFISLVKDFYINI